MRNTNCVRKISAGLFNDLFIRKDFTLTGLGQDNYQNLINGPYYAGPPVYSGKPAGRFIDVACGSYFCLAIDQTDGHIAQWGVTEYGLENSPPPAGIFTKVAAANITGMALKLNGSIEVWRLYSNSQITDKPTTGVYVDIACGPSHCLAIKNDGTIVGWGDNGHEECNAPALGPGETYIAIACGLAHSLALKTDGNTVTLVKWGMAIGGTFPSAPTSPVKWIKISANYRNAMALRSDGTAAAWGDDWGWYYNDTGQRDIPSGKNFGIIDIACGYSHNVALKWNGSVLSWGENLGAVCTSWHNRCFKASTGLSAWSAPWGGATTLLKTDGTIVFASAGGKAYISTPLPRFYGNYVKISGGDGHFLGLTQDGICHAWGLNYAGQCDVPADTFFTEIAAGNGCSFGIKTDGTIIGWGMNYEGFISHIPAGTFVKISVSLLQTAVAIRTDGTLAVWCGNSDDFGGNTPPGNDFIDVSAGTESHAMALRSDGSVAIWGQTGEGYNWLDLPETNEGIVGIAAGFMVSAALYANGSILIWGDNTFNKCDVPEPNIDFIHISCRANTFVGIRKNLTAVAWGYNVWLQCEIGI